MAERQRFNNPLQAAGRAALGVPLSISSAQATLQALTDLAEGA
jgi:hypothetical protein